MHMLPAWHKWHGSRIASALKDSKHTSAELARRARNLLLRRFVSKLCYYKAGATVAESSAIESSSDFVALSGRLCQIPSFRDLA